MERIGVRELRQHASRWLRRVAAGERFEVTDRGRPVAWLVPPVPDRGLAALRTAGRLRPGTGVPLSQLPPPVAPTQDRPTASEALRLLRRDER